MSGTEVVRPYRGVSAADRRADRRARLHEACLDVVGQAGVADVTVERVCASAGLTKRYFYESFSDRDALLDEVIARFFLDLHEELSAAVAATPAVTSDRAAVTARILIGYLERDPRRARLYVEAPGNPTLGARLDEAYQTFVRVALDIMPGPASSGREAAALIVVAGITQAAIAWLRGQLRLDREEIIVEISRAIEAVIGS